MDGRLSLLDVMTYVRRQIDRMSPLSRRAVA